MPVIQKEQTKPCEYTIEIEVDTEQVTKAYNEVYKDLGKQVQMPGFRKGKAPVMVLKQFLAEDRVKEDVAEKLVQAEYEKAIEETGIEPYGPGEYEVVELEEDKPFKFKIKVPLEPKVELGQYTGLEVDRLVPVVSDEDVQREIDEIRNRAAKVENVEGRPVEKGDIAILNITEPNGEIRSSVVEAGANLESFDAGIIGMNKDETKTIEVTYPEDYKDDVLAGKTESVTVTVTDIKSREVPELTDELVKELLGEGEEKIETVDELKQRISSAMEKAATDMADKTTEDKIVQQVVENSKVDFPAFMLRHEIEHRFEDLMQKLKSRKLTMDEYLQYTGQTADDLYKKFEEAAERDMKVNLALFEIATKEDIKVTDEDVDKEIEVMAEGSKMPVESVRAYIDKTEGRSSIENRLLYRKVLEFLVKASNIKHVGREAS